MLSRLSDIEAVTTADSGREALDLLRQGQVDLALLDIEMPEVDGFDVVEGLESPSLASRDVPLIVFVTAFRRFAPQAFDSGAVDFLTKPVRVGRLEQALNRARDALAGREARRRMLDLQATVETLRNGQPSFREAHIWVPRRGENIRIDLDQVDRVVAEGAYVRLHVESNSFLYREVMGSIEAKFDPDRFLRVHRSHMVRLDNVTAIRRTLHGGAELVLKDGELVPVGRKYARAVRRRLLSKAHDL
jgi:DNA-binding LytR/AlgR family response regulator